MGVMEMRNIVPRPGIEPIRLAFQASVLPLHHVDKHSPVLQSMGEERPYIKSGETASK